MKKTLALGLALLLAASFSACAAKGASSAGSVPPAGAVHSAPVSAPELALEPLPLATDTNALTGLPRAQGMVEGQRPFALMVANNERALPQRGLAAADVIYEMLTEGGITRMMAMYGDANTVPTVGPIRSTRDQFVQFAYPTRAILGHIGTSVYAKNLLDFLDYRTVDGFYLGTTAFGFDVPRSLPKPGGKLNENCWFTDATLMRAGLQTKGMQPTGEVRSLFHFATQPQDSGQEAYRVRVTFSDIAASTFVYSVEDGLFGKRVFGKVHGDESGETLRFENVILLYCPIALKPDGRLPEFDLRGGSGLYCNKGGVQPITWTKGEPSDALRLFAADGSELEVQPGKSYIGILPAERAEAVKCTSKDVVEQEAAAKASAEPALVPEVPLEQAPPLEP